MGAPTKWVQLPHSPTTTSLVAVAGGCSISSRVRSLAMPRPLGVLVWPQEMLEKAPQLPKDISWAFIGHLQVLCPCP